MYKRIDNRAQNDLRPLNIVTDFQLHPTGSVAINCGNTRVLCSVSVNNSVPRWMKEQDVPGGWITSEYSMLPGATHSRGRRASSSGHPNGRSQEIQRLIGRSLRAIIDIEKLPAKTFYVDCDVLDADGGTRCASITGGAIALEMALLKLQKEGELNEWPLKARAAAISVGIVEGSPVLDLCYEEDSAADVDMNVVMNSENKFIEIQGTAENDAFSDEEMQEMLGYARKGLNEIFTLQEKVISEWKEKQGI